MVAMTRDYDGLNVTVSLDWVTDGEDRAATLIQGGVEWAVPLLSLFWSFSEVASLGYTAPLLRLCETMDEFSARINILRDKARASLGSDK